MSGAVWMSLIESTRVVRFRKEDRMCIANIGFSGVKVCGSRLSRETASDAEE
jgi:hypothetical protein